MKKLILLLALFGVLGVSCSKDDDNVNNSQKPNDKPKGTFVTDVEGVYTVDMSGGEVVVTVTSDIEYKVVIPTDAKSWISIAETRADLRIDKIKFIIAPNETFEELKADVNLVANNGYVLQKISFVQQGNTKVFNSDCEESYSIEAVGGKINIKISTNLDYDVVIPNNDKSWISVADTRAVVREETLTLIVAENKITEERSSVVTLYDKDDNILQKINIAQSAKSNTIANNEIWYTTTDGKKLFPPTTEPAIFGAFLVSNTYSDGKGVLTFDDDITLIGGSAFSDCTTLATITIPESVTTIGDDAFEDCSSLTSITIPESVTTIGNYAFRNCSSLTSVTIPDSVTTIGESAFSGCSSLTSVYITDLPAWYKIDFGNTAANPLSNGANLYRNNKLVTDLVIPSDITEIKPYIFSGCSSLTSVTIPDSVTSIGEYAFYGCTGELIVNCNIPASSSSYGAFYGGKFTSVTIGDSVTTIGNYAFEDCSSLTSVTIGDSVTTIGYRAFYNCTGELFVNCNIPAAASYSSGAFRYSAFTSVTIGDSVTTIGDWAFDYCSSLTSVTIPDSVTTIGVGAFEDCSSLTSVYITDLLAWCKIGFGGVTANPLYYAKNLYLNNELVKELVIPSDITEIKSYAFYKCSSLTSVTIPDSVTSIGYRAFYYCSSLTSVTIPDSVITIGDGAFLGCSSLTSVTIPDGVTTIESGVFYGCSSLTSVTIGDSVTTIGYQAFYDCSSLTSVYCKAVTPPTAVSYDYGDWYTFDKNASGRKIYVPTGSVEAYKSANYWKDYANAIVGYDF